jgi:hypothetical protein
VNEQVSIVDRYWLKLLGLLFRKGKRAYEMIQGHDLFRKTKQLVLKYRLINRINDWYHEQITDPGTGKVIHKCEEPLSQNYNHGSAKTKK